MQYSLATLLLCAIWLCPGESKVTKQKLAIPSYFWPSGDGVKYWSMIEKANDVGIAIVNPNSGPGDAKVQSFADVMQKSVNAGKKVLVYIDTGYFGVSGRQTKSGSTSSSDWTAQVKRQVDQAYEFYGSSGLSGIFLDDALNECGPQNKYVNFYRDIYNYIKGKKQGALVVINPGAGVEQCYASVADVILTFEHDYQSYLSWTQPSWSQNEANGMKFWHLIYATKNQADMENAIKLSKQRNAGYVYVTDDDLPNPWDTLPSSYWNDELRVAAQAN